jgi:hypothetical protein
MNCGASPSDGRPSLTGKSPGLEASNVIVATEVHPALTRNTDSASADFVDRDRPANHHKAHREDGSVVNVV